MAFYRATQVVAIALVWGSGALAQGFSTSATNPAALPPNGVIAGHYPAGEAETSYYFVADLKAGNLATQISVWGGAKYKTLTLALVESGGRRIDSYYITAGAGDNNEGTRVFPVDSSGRYLIRVSTEGPETTAFRVSLGGSALPGHGSAPAASGGPSQSFLNPTPVPADGVIAGTFPGGAPYTYYYFAADLKAGNLLTQMSVSGREGAAKWVSLALLDETGRSAHSYFMSRTEANADATRSFPVDHSGHYIMRFTVQGAEGTKYKVEFGGNAFGAN